MYIIFANNSFGAVQNCEKVVLLDSSFSFDIAQEFKIQCFFTHSRTEIMLWKNIVTSF